MKILYVNPSRLSSGLDAVIKGPPLSLLSIAGMVPEHEARLFDFKVDKFREKQLLREMNRSDVVAITSMTPQIFHAFEVAEMAKQQGATTIIGGYQPTLDPMHVIRHPSVDYIIRGEGEHSFKEMIDFLDGNKKKVAIKEIDGVSYKNKEGKIIHNNDRHLEINLDNFGMPRRDLIRGKKYSYMGARVDQVESSRGCPHSCKFCCIIKMWKDPSKYISYRSKSIPRIMREVYDVDWRKDFIFFCEDNFTIQLKRTTKILDTIIRAGIPSKIHFSAQSRVDTIYRNPWLVKKLVDAGFRQIFLGIETVHQQSLDAMNKGNTTPAMTKKVVEMLRDVGISVFGGIIIGYPGETREMVYETIKFAKSLSLDIVQFTPITAFPGTDFHAEMKEKGMITSYNYKHYDLFHSMMKTEQLTNREIYRLAAEAYAAFYLSNDYIKGKAKEYLNPFGKFRWMFNSLGRLIKQFIMDGRRMFHSQGIAHRIVPEELKNYEFSLDDINQERKATEKTIPSSSSLKMRERPLGMST